MCVKVGLQAKAPLPTVYYTVVVVRSMRRLANFTLTMAKAFASLSGSKLEIRTEDNSVSVRFTKPVDTETRLWKDYYSNAAIYIKDACEPVYLERKKEESGEYNIKSSNYLKTFMEQQVIKQSFNAKGMKNQRLEYLLYACLGGIGVVAMLMLVI